MSPPVEHLQPTPHAIALTLVSVGWPLSDAARRVPCSLKLPKGAEDIFDEPVRGGGGAGSGQLRELTQCRKENEQLRKDIEQLRKENEKLTAAAKAKGGAA